MGFMPTQLYLMQQYAPRTTIPEGEPMSTVAFVGLGAMGSRMAHNLQVAGEQPRA